MMRRADAPLGIGAATLLAVMLLLGGGGGSYPIVGAIVEGLALLLIAWTVASGSLLPPRHGTIVPWAIGLLALLLPLAQLIPIPPAAWLSLPGHALPARILAATEIPIGWRPLSLDPALTEMTALELLPGLALFWAALRIDDAGRLRLVSIAVGAAVASALLGAAQKVAGGDSPLILFTTAHADNAPGLFVNRNHQACFLLAAMPQLAAITRLSPAMLRLGRLERSAIFLTLIGLLAAGAIATSSRMALLLLLPATLASLAIAFGFPRRPVHLLGALLLAGGAAALASLSSAFAVAVARLGVEEDSRTLFWATTREAILIYWPAGSGIGSFPRIYPTVEHLDTLAASFPYNAHDDYLELLLEGGAPAALLLLAAGSFLIVALVRLLRSRRREDALIGLASWCSIVLILCHSIVDYPLRMLSIMALFGMLAGVVASASSSVPPARAGGRGMRVPPRTRKATTVATSIILVPCVLFGAYRIVSSAGAQSALLAADYPGAFQLDRRWSDASATRAQQALRERQLAAAHALAILATESSPLDPQGPTSLILIDQAQGKRTAADRILDVLPRLGWRHAPAQYLLAFRTADRGDLAGAIPHVDTLLRQGLYKQRFYPFLRAAAGYPDGLVALTQQLATRPTWRDDYLGNLADLQAANFGAQEALLLQLRFTAAPPSASEINAYLRRLARDGDYRAAIAAEQRLFGVHRDANLIHDASFRNVTQRAGVGGPFDWQSAELPGVFLDPSPKGLHLRTDESASGAVLRQIVTARAGTHRLSWRTGGQSSQEPDAISWAIRCLHGSYLPVTRDRSRGHMTSITFDVPPVNCSTLQVELMIDHRTPEPMEITITDVRLVHE